MGEAAVVLDSMHNKLKLSIASASFQLHTQAGVARTCTSASRCST